MPEATRRLAALVGRVRADAGLPPEGAAPWHTSVACLAGADYPEDVRRLRAAFAPIARDGHGDTLILNDTFAVLRAGATRPWGIALICGQGINAAAVTARWPTDPVRRGWRHRR